MTDQVNKQIEDLGLDSDEARSSPQLAAVRIERTFPEQIAQYLIPLVIRRPWQQLSTDRKGKMEGTLSRNRDAPKDATLDL